MKKVTIKGNAVFIGSHVTSIAAIKNHSRSGKLMTLIRNLDTNSLTWTQAPDWKTLKAYFYEETDIKPLLYFVENPSKRACKTFPPRPVNAIFNCNYIDMPIETFLLI